MFFGGYRFEEQGVCVWPGRRVRWKWEELQWVELVPMAGRYRPEYVVNLRFGESGKVRVRRPFSRRMMDAVSVAVKHGEGRAYIGERVRRVLEWWSAEEQRDELARARRYHMRLKLRRAQREVGRVLEQKPRDVEALRLRAELELERGRGDRGVEQLEELLQQHPEDAQGLRLLACALLAKDEERGVEVAQRVLGGGGDDVAIRHALANHYLRQEQGELAVKALEPLLERARVRGVRETAAANIEVVQRYSADGTFRLRVKRRAAAKGIQLLIVWLVFLAVLVLFGAWMRDCRAARKRGVAQELAVEQWREQLRSMIDEGRVFTTNAVGEYATYEHVVVEGQWELLQVAMIRNVSEALLMEINGLETGALEVGQVVKIPMTEPEVRLRRAMGHL